MIRRVYSSLPKFKTLQFTSGLNVLLADKTERSTAKQTRNRAGKSSFVEIVHFLLGADCKESSIFRSEALAAHSFGMDVDIDGARLSVERSGGSYANIRVLWLDGRSLADDEPLFAEGNEIKLSNTRWRQLLGQLMFGLASNNSQKKKYQPSFRSLFSYFARRAGAFVEPTMQSSDQQRWDQQVAISYLLSLDWDIASDWQVVREKEKALKELKRVASGGELSDIVGKTSELRAALALAEERVARVRETVRTYRVLPTYREHEAESSRLTAAIHALLNENHVDRVLVRQLQEALRSETPPEIDDVERVYREAGVLLSKRSLRQFEDVQRFHESVVSNRRSYLQDQLQSANSRIAGREAEIASLDERRAQLLSELRTHGALDELASIQAELARQEAEAEVLRKRYDAASQLEGTSASLKLERGQLLLRLQRDHRERGAQLRKAIVAIESLSGELYEHPGKFLIDATENGPEFSIKIPGDRSKGIGNMEIFAFDMMLLRVTAERGTGPKFLIHDSHLFDGVDSRQKAMALHIGKRVVGQTGCQYIVTMNSDDWPAKPEYPEAFDAANNVMAVRLTDASEDGGLFGMRFD